jgi:CRP/FNR family cyclic AMP-dependent transcriptional regulator
MSDNPMNYDLLALFSHERSTVLFKAGQTIFEDGQPGDKMYVVLEGEVGIFAQGRMLRTAPPGTCFGEMALIDNAPRTGSAIARTDVRLVPIDRNRFVFMVQETPYFALHVMHIMAERLRAQSK